MLPQLPSHPQNAREDTWQWDGGIPAARFLLPAALSSSATQGSRLSNGKDVGERECWQERLLRLTGEGLHPTCPPVLSLQLQEGREGQMKAAAEPDGPAQLSGCLPEVAVITLGSCEIH